VGAVALSPTWRRPALLDGTGAVLFATGGLTSSALLTRAHGGRRR
jgi:hypothetical protein